MPSQESPEYLRSCLVDVFPVSPNLDSSLKKNTGFIRKVRTSLNEASLPSLLKDISTLTLVKYLSEIVSALTEGFTQCKSTASLLVGVEVSSALFQRFGPEFCGPLLSNMLHGVANPPKSTLNALTAENRQREAKARLERQRIVIRIIIELWLAGVFRSSLDLVDYDLPSFATVKNKAGTVDPPPLASIKEILSSDLVTYSPVTITIMIIKNYKDYLLGNESLDVEDESTKFVSREMQFKFRKVFTTYARSMETYTRSKARMLIKLEQSNEMSYLRAGRINQTRENDYAVLLEECEKLVNGCTELFNLLGLKLWPIQLVSGKTIKEDGNNNGNWEDDYERNFYENIINLSPRKDEEAKTPEIDHSNEDEELIKDFESIKVEPTNVNEGKKSKKEKKDSEAESFVYKEKVVEDVVHTGDAEETTANGEKMMNILMTLSSKTSKEVADQCALDFRHVNNRASRRKVLNFFLELKTTDQHKLPIYTRFIATLAPICPDLVSGILAYLENYFRYIIKKPYPSLYLARLYVMRFFSEMIKFKLVPKKTIFYLLHASITRLSHHTAEIISHLLEGCGRFLFRNPETNFLLLKYLDLLKDQQAKQYLAVEDRMMIASALYYVNPPPEIKAEEKKRPIIEKYIRKLIYIDLDSKSALHVFKKLMMMDWEDPDTLKALKKVFCKIWRVKQGNIQLMAKFIESIKPYYPSFTVMVIDSILEDIKVGVEQGGYKNNQKRISQVTYLGELYNNRIIDHNIVMSTLYLILTFGYPNNQPTPYGCPLDPNDELFRIRLVCSLLDSCGKVLNHTDAAHPEKGIGSQIDVFMYFLQYFIQCKQNMSVDVEFQVRDTFKLMRPDMPIYTSLQTSSEALKSIIAGKVPEPETIDNEDFDDAEDDITAVDEVSRDSKYFIPKKPETELSEIEKERLKAKEARKQKRREEKENQKAIDDFEAEFQNMMLERYKNTPGKRSTFDIPVPKHNTPEVNYVPSKDGSKPQTLGKVEYMLLTKKVNKQDLKGISLPQESKFVESVLREKENRWKAQERIRNIVLRYEREHLDDDSPMENDPLRPIMQPKIVRRRVLTTESIEKMKTVDPETTTSSSGNSAKRSDALDK